MIRQIYMEGNLGIENLAYLLHGFIDMLQKAAAEYGAMMLEARKPWPGWVPVVAALDKDIIKAYRALFLRMNAEAGEELAAKFTLRNRRIDAGKIKVTWPPDGWYEFKNGRMEPTGGNDET